MVRAALRLCLKSFKDQLSAEIFELYHELLTFGQMLTQMMKDDLDLKQYISQKFI